MEEIEGQIQTEEDRARRRYFQLWMNHIQIMWSAWKLGLVSSREWEAYRRDIADFLQNTALQEHWAEASRFYPEGFRQIIMALSQTAPRRSPRPVT